MSDQANLAAAVGALSNARVLCVGDIMLDRYVVGRVDRVSPEAPVPVLRVEGRDSALGGVGNVVRNLSALGAGGVLAGVIGADAAGDEVRALLAETPSVEPRLVIDPSRPTTVKTRFIAGAQQVLRVDEETDAPVSDQVGMELAGRVAEVLPACDALLLSDYAKGVLTEPLAHALVSAARGCGKPVVVDPKGPAYHRYRGASVVTPNRAELSQAVGAAVPRGEEAAAALGLAQTHGFGAVLVTLGRDGMLLVPADGAPLHLPAEAREVFDVSGAGDTVAATLTAALAVGRPLAESAALANIAAGIVVGKVGTAVAHADELLDALRRQDRRADERKIASATATAERVQRWRRRGLRVGFTNGCFDLVHPGHLSLLRQARAACDRLVVAVNSDASVARLKGAGRPVQPESSRALVLASLATVDAVVVFSEDTPIDLVRELRPDVLVKGADYSVGDIVGADVVQSYGGRVVLARLEPGYSTSTTVARLQV